MSGRDYSGGGGSGAGSSGAGGKSGGGGGGGGGNAPVNCEELALETQLTSPKADVIAGLQVGEVMQVALKSMGGVYLVQVLRNGQVAGGLTAPDVKKLRECLIKNFKYDATVIAVNDGQVRVRITAAQ